MEITRKDVCGAIGQQSNIGVSQQTLEADADAAEMILKHPQYPDLLQKKASLFAMSPLDKSFSKRSGEVTTLEVYILRKTGTQSHHEQIASAATRIANRHS